MKFTSKLLISIADDDSEAFTKIFKARGLDPNTRDDYGRNLLHWACQENSVKIVKELLENYPDLLNLEDSDGQTELCIAAGEGNLDVVKFLLTLGANTDVAGDSKAASALQIAVLYEHEMVVEELLMSGANPDAINGEGYSARMYAEDALNGEIKKLLK